jgi:hypothetical protein
MRGGLEMPIRNLRRIFSDYYIGTAINLPPLMQWKDYSFHFHESSLRGAENAERKIRDIMAGHTVSGQVWTDLRGKYGLSDSRGTLNDLASDFIAYCITAPSTFAKECWLYRAQKNSNRLDVRLLLHKKMRNLQFLMSFVPNRYTGQIFDNSVQSNKVLSFAEHLTQYPLALKRFFELPNWNDLVLLADRTDNGFDNLISRLSPSESDISQFLRRVKTFNRDNERRVYFVKAMLITPTLDRIDVEGKSPVIIHKPFDRFFSEQDVMTILNQIDSYSIL